MKNTKKERKDRNKTNKGRREDKTAFNKKRK
jgi:hypothetical protein